MEKKGELDLIFLVPGNQGETLPGHCLATRTERSWKGQLSRAKKESPLATCCEAITTREIEKKFIHFRAFPPAESERIKVIFLGLVNSRKSGSKDEVSGVLKVPGVIGEI